MTLSHACIDDGRTGDLLPNQCIPAAPMHVTDDHNIQPERIVQVQGVVNTEEEVLEPPKFSKDI